MIPRTPVQPPPGSIPEEQLGWCRCGDPLVDRLDLLVAVGWDQRLASLALWDRGEFFRRWDANATR